MAVQIVPCCASSVPVPCVCARVCEAHGEVRSESLVSGAAEVRPVSISARLTHPSEVSAGGSVCSMEMKRRRHHPRN